MNILKVFVRNETLDQNNPRRGRYNLLPPTRTHATPAHPDVPLRYVPTMPEAGRDLRVACTSG